MLPIRDHNPSAGKPFISWALLLANIGIFLATWPFFPDDNAVFDFFVDWGMVPLLITEGYGFTGVVTSMFLHAGWAHLIGNMMFLWIFADNLEEEMGHWRFLLFYLLCGVAAAAIQYLADPYSQIPMVGASGAIAGVMGGYLLLYPKARVDVFLFFLIFFRIVPVPAWILLVAWFGLQLMGSFSTGGAESGVAHWAHAGGFVAGLAMTLPLWQRLGGVGFWRETHGEPDYSRGESGLSQSRIPRVTRRR